MNDWMPQSTRGNIAQHVAPMLVLIAAVVVFLASVIR